MKLTPGLFTLIVTLESQHLERKGEEIHIQPQASGKMYKPSSPKNKIPLSIFLTKGYN